MHDGEHDAAYRAASLLAACMAGGNSVDLTKSLHALLPAARYFAVAVKVGSEAHLSFQLHLGSTTSGGGNGAPGVGPNGATTLPEPTASSTGRWHRMSLSACAGTLSGWVASSERAVAVLADRGDSKWRDITEVQQRSPCGAFVCLPLAAHQQQQQEQQLQLLKRQEQLQMHQLHQLQRDRMSQQQGQAPPAAVQAAAGPSGQAAATPACDPAAHSAALFAEESLPCGVQEQQQLWNRDGEQGQCFGTLTIGFDSGVAASSGSSIRGTLLLARELWQENVRDQLLQLAVASAALVSARSPSTSGSLAAIPEEQSEEEEEEEEAEEEEEGDLLEEMIAAADDELRTYGEAGREAAAGSAYHSAHSTTPLPAPMLAAGNVTLAASPAYGLGTPLPLLSGSADPRLLSFLDEGEESDFERYHASRMMKLDALACFAKGTLKVLQGPSAASRMLSHPRLLQAWTLVPDLSWLYLLLPLMLISSPLLHSKYLKHREKLILAISLMSLLWSCLSHCMLAATEAPVEAATLASRWCTAVPSSLLLFQVRFKFQLPLAMLGLAASAICHVCRETRAVVLCDGTCTAASPLQRCLAVMHGGASARDLAKAAAQLLLLYILEVHTRRHFMLARRRSQRQLAAAQLPGQVQ